jgi:hypothetical protein
MAIAKHDGTNQHAKEQRADLASAAEKNTTGGGTCASSRRIETGMNASSQLMDGLTRPSRNIVT